MRTRSHSRRGARLQTSEQHFPLLELPDDVLANVLQRCPPGSIAGFPLPLALAQIRVTGSVDPYWLRPLLHAASKCPAVLDHLSRHLRSLELLETQNPSFLTPIAPFLTRLERLSIDIDEKVSTATLAALPTGLTKLSVMGIGLEGGSPEDLSALLLRLTALEELELGNLREQWNPVRWVVGGTLPRLRRLKCGDTLPEDVGTFAPNLEVLEKWPRDFSLLPITLTKLSFGWDGREDLKDLSLTRLKDLKDLGLPSGIDLTKQLPELLAALTALTRLHLQKHIDGLQVPHLLEALKKGPEGLGLSLSASLDADARTPGLERLFRHLVEGKIHIRELSLVPWAALTRLTRLDLFVDGSKGASWIQPLSRLPSLKDLEIELRGKVPRGFGALTQCTWLKLRHIKGTANLSCLQHLTRLRECNYWDAEFDMLMAMPDCLAGLTALDFEKSRRRPYTHAVHSLTALESLDMAMAEGMDWTCDLSALKRLTALRLIPTACPLVRLGPLPCLRSLNWSGCRGLDDDFLRQLGEKAPSLRELKISPQDEDVLSDDSLAPLSRMSLLEMLELPRGRITPKGIRWLLDHLPLLDWLKVFDRVNFKALCEDPDWADLKRQAGVTLMLKQY